MKRTQRFLRSSFGSAAIGGLIVGLLFVVAISAGWVDSGDEPAPVAAQAALAAPVASHDQGGDTNVVGDIYKRDGQGVAFIEADQPVQEASPFEPFGQPEGGGTATGSGFVIDEEGHLLTNNHVVEGATDISVKLGSDDKAYPAKVVGTDPATDVALLKVDVPADKLHPLALGDSSDLEVGDPVVAIGNPFGLDRTVTSGIVSALQRQIEAPNGFSISNVIQTDAAINPGNSGGPLIDSQGNVIGINSQIETGGGGNGNVGIGFAIPIDTIRAEIKQLETKGEVAHAFLGISGGTITPELAKALNLPVKEGVIVQQVVKDGPADKAGLEAGNTSATINGEEVRLGGDIITEANGKKVKSMEELVEDIQDSKPGDTLELKILRDGHEKTADVTLGTQPKNNE